jgi:hypothetical protein
MNKQEILNRYKDIVLGDTHKNEQIYVDKFSSEDDLIHTMYEFLSREVDVYPTGIQFLKEYWGYENIADLIFKYEKDDGDFHQTYKTKRNLIEWLKKCELSNSL